MGPGHHPLHHQPAAPASTPGPLTPSRLELLQFLRRYLAAELARVDEWIRRETLREEDRRGQRMRAARAAERPWWIHHEDGRPIRPHHAGRFITSRHDDGQPCTRPQALTALAQGAEPCSGCQPETELNTARLAPC
ncbi:hypothetical protein [Streptomyces sp. 8L]|uniref:hypothetical protein n=1 Tax=Streptomyces sp. 8L TaxID=2877242 RepID=UPI001CD6E979|nr:hypothetical protein [Streptomyces sp. 8L]MCA1217217.1 hypothetical protein [Streptomyces sp. 8L]